MQRRYFLTRLISTLASAVAAPLAARAHARLGASGDDRTDNTAAAHTPAHLHLQDCRIAGSHHYECLKLLGHIKVGDRLDLRAEPANPHDRRAIEIYWHGRKLGYLPRRDNAAAASLLERGHTLRGEIVRIDDPAEKWEPVKFRVWWDTPRRAS